MGKANMINPLGGSTETDIFRTLLEFPSTQFDTIIDNNLTQILTPGNKLFPIYNTNVREIRFPNCETLGSNAVFYCGSGLRILELGKSLKISTSSNATFGQGFIKFQQSPSKIKIIGVDSLGAYSAMSFTQIKHQWFTDVKSITKSAVYSNSSVATKTVTLDNITSIYGESFYGTNPNSTFTTLIIKTPTLCQLSVAFTRSDISNGFTKIYVPNNLLNNYKTESVWSRFASQLYGINEDTACGINDTFTPSYSGSDVTHWDFVNLQEETVATIDTSTGTITPSDNGRILIRGLDVNEDIKYVAYLIIGNGGF